MSINVLCQIRKALITWDTSFTRSRWERNEGHYHLFSLSSVEKWSINPSAQGNSHFAATSTSLSVFESEMFSLLVDRSSPRIPRPLSSVNEISITNYPSVIFFLHLLIALSSSSFVCFHYFPYGLLKLMWGYGSEKYHRHVICIFGCQIIQKHLHVLCDTADPSCSKVSSQFKRWNNLGQEITLKFHVNRHHEGEALCFVLSNIIWWNNFAPVKINEAVHKNHPNFSVNTLRIRHPFNTKKGFIKGKAPRFFKNQLSVTYLINTTEILGWDSVRDAILTEIQLLVTKQEGEILLYASYHAQPSHTESLKDSHETLALTAFLAHIFKQPPIISLPQRGRKNVQGRLSSCKTSFNHAAIKRPVNKEALSKGLR